MQIHWDSPLLRALLQEMVEMIVMKKHDYNHDADDDKHNLLI